MDKKRKFLLVCEGPTDVVFIKKLSAKLGEDLNTYIEIVELSPQKDATTNRWPGHGWHEVKNWCNNYKNKTVEEIEAAGPTFADILRRRNYKALIAISGADGLIIQMDTDIAEMIRDVTPQFSPDTGSRREFCEKAALSWLGETKESLENTYLLLPSYAIESWLLATWPPTDDVFADLKPPIEYETIADVEQRLITLGVPSTTKRQQIRLAKTPEKYTFYATKVHKQIEDVKQRCPEAQAFCSYLTAHCD